VSTPVTVSRQQVLDHITLRLISSSAVVCLVLFLLHRPIQFVVLGALIGVPALGLVLLRLILALPAFQQLTWLSPVDALLIAVSYSLILFCIAEMAFPEVNTLTVSELPLRAFVSWASLPVTVCLAALSWLVLTWPAISRKEKSDDHHQRPS
jgi:hypothetical protein